MTIIQSGASADLATVDPLSKSLRVTLYDPSGALQSRVNDGKYAAKIEIIPTGLAANTCYFAALNAGLKSIAIDRIFLTASFVGAAAATRSIFMIQRFTSAVPAGGVPVLPVPYKSTYPATTLGNVLKAPGGVTMTGAIYEQYWHEYCVMSQLVFQAIADLYLGENDDEQFILLPGEGICIRAESAIVLGAALIGSMHYHEYTGA